MNKIEEIFKAWNISFNPDNEQAEQASKRIEICNGCEHKKTTLGVNTCGVCGCALKAKVFSPIKGACPEGKWDDVDGKTELETIFIQIASYRDPELLPTLRDAIDRAKHPERLRFGICWQHNVEDEWDNLDEFANHPHFRVIDVPHNESKGACWARNQIQQQYQGEDYTLQLDSHHRFIQDWDKELIEMVRTLQLQGIEKPLLTSYISAYNPKTDPEGRTQEPWQMNFDRFTPEGVVFFLPGTIPNYSNLKKPLRARFYSAHFAFTVGQFCNEVQHDPEYYFHGEEISIAVRAYTHGYDLFHPHKIIAWHEYTREGRTKHWDDASDWGERNTKCHQRLRQLLGIDGTEKVDFGKYGLGTKRTLADYEAYSGVRFSDRNIQQWTLDHKYPPNPPDGVFHSRFKHILDISSDWFKRDDYTGLGIFIEKKDGTQLFRKDLNEREFKQLLQKEHFTQIVEFTGEKPDKWVVWAYSAEGWHERIERDL